ncbi:hotdog fold thioesterase [Leadbetterella sp. DM7]|uniref:hotdog fold thioesterase n=1 Tax=Leadbetterella sp. DM7 TaxID=3235085 RepID=UPI00349EB035
MFKNNIDLDVFIQMSKNTLGDHLGIEFIEKGDDYLVARMPVDHRTKQPFGLLHGGASVALAETLGSIASVLCLDDPAKEKAVGLEINANHVRSVTEGWVYGKVSPIHIGRRTHLWDIKITNEEGKLVCISRLTVAIV